MSTTTYTVTVVGEYDTAPGVHPFTRKYDVTVPTVEDPEVYVSDVLEDAVFEPLHGDPTFPANRVFGSWDVESWVEH